MNYPLKLNRNVATALKNDKPVVALESTIVSHGMPFPDNVGFANKAEKVVTDGGAVPATIALLHGIIHVGLNESQLRYIADTNNKIEKIATRDIGFAVANKFSGATTVSATMRLALLAGIKVFATGGIGGVHRDAENTFDVSQDLIELSRTPIIVVSAGVKAILDIPKTLEQLETLAVSVVGYKTNEFPAFYSRFSGSQLANKCDSPEDVAAIFSLQNNLKIKSALLIANPVPEADEIPKNEIDNLIDIALKECKDQGVKGKAVTPFLLKRIVGLTEGRSLKANIALALNNVRVATEIAKELK